MNKVQLGVDGISTTLLTLGFEGEQNHTQVVIYWTALYEQYPSATATMVIKPPTGDAYPKVITQDGNRIIWDVSAADTSIPGSGSYQLTFTDGDEIIKTFIGSYRVLNSITGSGEAPDPVTDWVNEANEVLASIPNTINEAVDNALEEAKESGDFKGDPGEPGAKGDKGDPGDPAPAEEVAEAVDAYLEENFSNPSNPPLDRSLTSALSAAPADLVGDLKSAFNSIGNPPKLRESTETDVDLDIADENGNVLVRLSNGDIHTKNFSSAKILGCKLTDANNADFDIADLIGNVILRLQDGHIKVKNFDSSNIIANGYLKGKVIVNFGDSIFGNKRPPNDISTTIANETGATVHNCGFGGCRMAKFDYSSLSTWGQFSMFELADAIAENDWTGQDAAVTDSSWSGMPYYFPETLALLKSIDFSEVDIVTIAYGTNDFTAGVALDDSNSPKSTSTFAGALRYSIETLLTAFPNLRIICCGQCYRWWDNSGAFVDDSNTHEVNGQLLTQFVSKTKDVAEEYNLQFINNYDIGIGKFTRSYFFTGSDTTHPNDIGTKLIARHIARGLY